METNSLFKAAAYALMLEAAFLIALIATQIWSHQDPHNSSLQIVLLLVLAGMSVLQLIINWGFVQLGRKHNLWWMQFAFSIVLILTAGATVMEFITTLHGLKSPQSTFQTGDAVFNLITLFSFFCASFTLEALRPHYGETPVKLRNAIVIETLCFSFMVLGILPDHHNISGEFLLSMGLSLLAAVIAGIFVYIYTAKLFLKAART